MSTLHSPWSWDRAVALARSGALTEDEFWAFQVPRWLETWRSPSPYEALRFAFDWYPRRSYELAQSVPCGVHGRPNVEAIRAVLSGRPQPTHIDELDRGDVAFWSNILGRKDLPLTAQ